ncbi:zona pellucida sperm-binding protein 3-like [Trachinotus anak]|uniref:zona pellucida sperm-binding protein 3-like n=1 Tax=Trachinotus anak TaxID=443729 RepID=UPI0039F17BAA
MGLGEAVLLGSVLLFSCGNLCVASRNWLNFSTNETLNQIPQEEVTASLQLPRSPQTADHQSNRTEQGDPVRSPVSYRLRSYQLRNPAVSKQSPAQPLAEQTQTFQNHERSEARKLTSEQLEPRETALAQELLKGPNLHPPVKQESKVRVKIEQRVPVPADSVAVRCGEGGVTVEVKQNFLGNGQLIRPSDLTLGGCAALDAADHILHFQTELQGCGSTMTMTQDALIYSFSLMYSPTPIGNTFILRTGQAEVVIECHYQRRHYVSSNAMRPTWKLFASNMLAEQQLHFSLRLMTEDWQSQRPSSVYFLSDVMHIEAAVLQGHHAPLRVYVDSCVATVNPDPRSQPRYPFISNHGCLTDAKLTGAKSYFMQRSQEDKLHFLLKAFRFHQDHRNALYITCHLKATTLSVPIDSQHKACSFLTEANRWVASGGDNKVCGCCESSCSEQRWKRSLAADDGLPSDLQWEGTAALGPILLEELTEVSELPPEPILLLQTRVIQTASHPSIALLCGVGAALAVVLLGFMGAVTCSRLHKPTAHTVCT